MLTEVDIERIMAAKRQLAESIADDSDYDIIEEYEEFETFDEDTPVTETKGLMKQNIKPRDCLIERTAFHKKSSMNQAANACLPLTSAFL